MRHASILVRAEWDPEACVWVATSQDVHGLSVESETIEALQTKVMGALADLIELNGIEFGTPDIPVHFIAERFGRIPNPAA